MTVKSVWTVELDGLMTVRCVRAKGVGAEREHEMRKRKTRSRGKRGIFTERV